MPPFILHPSYILKEGLDFCGIGQERQDRLGMTTKIRLFKSHYGRHPLHLSRVYRDLQIQGLLDTEDAKCKTTFHAFLLGNNMLKCYDEGDLMYSRFPMGLENIAELSWEFIEKIASLKPYKIKCPTQWPVKLGASVDGTHYATNEPRDPNMRRNPQNFSYKHNVAGLNYQIVLSLWTQEIYYANSGDPASVHDMTAIRAEFLDMVPANCRVVADAGYSGKTEREKRIFSVENNLDCEAVKELKARAKSRHETINSRLKLYKCLKHRGRHGIEKHKLCFAACLVLIQYSIEDTSPAGEPLFTI